ncbi:hypothetical protein ACLOJK_022628 [Asimina triloba]
MACNGGPSPPSDLATWGGISISGSKQGAATHIIEPTIDGGFSNLKIMQPHTVADEQGQQCIQAKIPNPKIWPVPNGQQITTDGGPFDPAALQTDPQIIPISSDSKSGADHQMSNVHQHRSMVDPRRQQHPLQPAPIPTVQDSIGRSKQGSFGLPKSKQQFGKSRS